MSDILTAHGLGARVERAGLARSSWLAIVAVSLTVGALSLTRMQIYAVHANERDAVKLVDQLGERLETPSDAALRELSEDLLHPVEGSIWSEDGSRLRRHGYLFELVEVGGSKRVRAWPSDHGVTGRAAYQWSGETGLRGHPNPEGKWSGPETPPDVLDGAEWVALQSDIR
ncbi:MAG: hypothetical protein ACYSWX_06130 [Planctomycetota bacterium]|jgi:hypothetical protein